MAATLTATTTSQPPLPPPAPHSWRMADLDLRLGLTGSQVCDLTYYALSRIQSQKPAFPSKNTGMSTSQDYTLLAAIFIKYSHSDLFKNTNAEGHAFSPSSERVCPLLQRSQRSLLYIDI